jgi:hypothetical protein
MSSENVSTSTTEKKPRAPTLPEKYSKFIQFGYFMMSKMQDIETFTKEDFLNQIQMFATVEEQQTFIQGFLDNQKENKKTMRKEIQERKKAAKPKKEKAPRKTKKPRTNTLILDDSDREQPKESQNAINMVESTENSNQENLIENITNELTEEPMIDRINTAIEVAKDITAKKPRAKKATSEKKPRATKKKQTKQDEPTTELTNSMETQPV